MQPENSSRLKPVIESAMVLLMLFILLYVMFSTVSAFLGVFAYAIIFSVPFYPLYEKLSRALGNRRKLASFIYGLVLVAVVAVPFGFIVSALINYVHTMQGIMTGLTHGQVPPLPDFIAGIPVVGEKAQGIWAALEKDPQGTLNMYGPQLKSFFQHLLSAGGGLVGAVLELVLGIIVSAVVLANGESALKPIRAILGKLAGEFQAEALLDASGRAIKGVAVGVMGTAFVAALAAWIGYKIAGIPIAVGLAALTFLLVVVQLGPVLVVIPVVLWLAHQGETGMAIFVAIYGLVVLMSIDNILKPILIARSGKLPILVLFIGVVGGMTAWGFTGMFKGAIALSLVYTLFQSWFGYKTKELAGTPAAS